MSLLEELKIKLESIEKSLLEEVGILYLSTDGVPYKVPENKDLKFFIEDFVRNCGSWGSYGPHTFHISGKVQCFGDKARSFGDIFLIAKYYFPDCTLFDVYKILVKLDSDDSIDYYYCPDIHKRVTVRYGVFERSSYYLTNREDDEYGIKESTLNLLL